VGGADVDAFRHRLLQRSHHGTGWGWVRLSLPSRWPCHCPSQVDSALRTRGQVVQAAPRGPAR
jgi:hypothetical protein